jgi:hypothetical protein
LKNADLAKDRMEQFSSLSLLLSPTGIQNSSEHSRRQKIKNYKKSKNQTRTIQSNELDEMIMNNQMKDVNKLALTDANKDLIDIHKKKEVENNFIMRALRS